MTGLQKKGGNKRSREASGRKVAILAGGIPVKGRLVMHSLEMCCKCDANVISGIFNKRPL